MHTVSRKQKNANFQLKMATFPLLFVRFFSKSIGMKVSMRWTNCESFTYRTKNVDFTAKTRKRLTDGRKDRLTDVRRKPRHDISSDGFQPVELKTSACLGKI